MATTAEQAATNGASVTPIVRMPVPQAIKLKVIGKEIVVPVRVSAIKRNNFGQQTGGNLGFRKKFKARVKQGVFVRDALARAVVEFCGDNGYEALAPAKNNLGENGTIVVTVSKPRLYDDRTKANFGQPMPGTGGNPIVSFVKKLPAWGEAPGYLLRVTCTGIVDDSGAHLVQTEIQCTIALKGREGVELVDGIEFG